MGAGAEVVFTVTGSLEFFNDDDSLRETMDCFSFASSTTTTAGRRALSPMSSCGIRGCWDGSHHRPDHGHCVGSPNVAEAGACGIRGRAEILRRIEESRPGRGQFKCAESRSYRTVVLFLKGGWSKTSVPANRSNRYISRHLKHNEFRLNWACDPVRGWCCSWTRAQVALQKTKALDPGRAGAPVDGNS